MKTTVYRYYCPFRPPMPGAIPRLGLLRVGDHDDVMCKGSTEYWGFAEYERPLTEQEIKDYELRASENNPIEYEGRLI